MTQKTAANLALALVVVGWILACYGAFSMMGDPSPSVSTAQLAAARHTSLMVLWGGVSCLAVSQWLAGYAFLAARKRALCTLAAVILPVMLMIANLF